MAGGRRFNSSGWVFTKSGGKFVHNDGTCETCDCDNPPGSGRNFVDCTSCPSNQGPASYLVTFASLTYASCSDISFGGFGSYMTWLTPLGSYCIPASGCGFVYSISGMQCLIYAAADSGCSGSSRLATGTLYLSGGSIGSGTFSITADAELVTTDHTLSLTARLFSGTGTSLDCTSSVSVTGDSPVIRGTGWSGASSHVFGILGTSGSAVVTPQFQLCP